MKHLHKACRSNYQHAYLTRQTNLLTLVLLQSRRPGNIAPHLASIGRPLSWDHDPMSLVTAAQMARFRPLLPLDLTHPPQMNLLIVRQAANLGLPITKIVLP